MDRAARALAWAAAAGAGAGAVQLWGWVPSGWLWWVAAAAALLLLQAWRQRRYFARRGIRSAHSLPFLGSNLRVAARRTTLADFLAQVYKAEGASPGAEPVVGLWEFARPILLVRDPGLLRAITTKHFDCFRNHRMLGPDSTDIFAKSLFVLRDQKWKDMRTTMTPAFTASKMRIVFELISKCGQQTVDYLENLYNDKPGGSDVVEVEFKDVFTRFASDVIATSAFGVECDSLAQPTNEFYLMGKEITNFGGLKGLSLVLLGIFPKIAEKLGVTFLGARGERFFRALVSDALSQRRQRGISRPDVLQLLMEASQAPHAQMTEEDIVAQAILFFFAGFETVSNLICFACYSLALHPEVQERLQREVDEALEASGGQLTYETVHQMKYLDMVISETLRLFPPLPAVDRECAQGVELPLGDDGGSVVFRKGDIIWVPIMAFQRDPRYWPRPDEFDPERFSDANKHRIQPFTYLPFGTGPRACIAQRLALMEAKAVLVQLLRRVRVSRVARTPVPMRFAKGFFNLASADGFWLGVSARPHPSDAAAPAAPASR